MNAIKTSVAAAALAAGAGIGSILVCSDDARAQLADSAWPMYRGNLQHTGRSPHGTVYVDGTVRWRHAPANNWTESSPVIGPDGTIYYATTHLHDDPLDPADQVGVGRLYAINPDGSEKWAQPFLTGSGMPLSDGTRKAVQATPAIAADGTVYFVALDDKLYAVNADDGAARWTFPIEVKKRVTFDGGATYQWVNVASSPAIGPDGTIYLGSQNGDITQPPDGFAGKLYAIRPDGSEKWTFLTGSSVTSSPAITPDGTIVYFGSGDGSLYAVNAADGSVLWSHSFRPNPPIPNEFWFVESSPTIAPDGTIYVGVGIRAPSGDYQGKLFAVNPGVNPETRVRWQYPASGRLDSEVWSSPAIGPDGTIYVGTGEGGGDGFAVDHSLYAFNPDGSVKWSFATGREVAASPVVGAGGIVYVGSMDGNLYAIDPVTGSEKWRFNTPGHGWVSSVAIGADGTVYAANDKLYAFDNNRFRATRIMIVVIIIGFLYGIVMLH